jgi:hypothetical protein
MRPRDILFIALVIVAIGVLAAVVMMFGQLSPCRSPSAAQIRNARALGPQGGASP